MGDPFRVDARIPMHSLLNALDESTAAFRSLDVACGMPALEIETTQQYWQLDAKITGLVAWQRVAQCMQRREQGQIGPLLVLPTEPRHERVDPLLGCPYCVVERLNA